MAGKLAIYRYDDLSFPKFKYGYYLAGFGSKILLTFILAFVIHHAKSMFFQSDSKELADTIISTLIGAIVLATLISKLFTSQKAGIIVSSHYLVFGEQTVLYQNIESIKVDEQHLTFNMIRTDGRKITITADKFQTNANKTHKIKKNKQDKFFKVVGNILKYTIALNPQVTCEITHAKRFKQFTNAS